MGNSEAKKRLISNFFSLSVLQGANYILPLITLPYLVRVLGPEKFGLIMFAQAFIQYFIILTDYGFNLSATREISVNRENKEKVSEIFSSVMIIKLLFLLVSFIILTAVVFSFEKFRKDWIVYYLTFGIVIGQGFLPVWFFQGMESMKYITFFNLSARFIYALSIFIFIKEQQEYWKVPLFNSLGFIFACALSIYIIFKKFKVNFFLPDKERIFFYLKESLQFFLSRVSVSLYTFNNSFILGLFTNNTVVGYYSMAEKLYIASQQIYQPLVNALYPYVSHKRDKKTFKKIFLLALTLNTAAMISVFFFSEDIINIVYGKTFYDTVNLLKIFSIINIFVVPSILLGYPYLAALGYPKYANLSVIFSSIFHLSLLILLIILRMINVYTVVLATLLTELSVLIIRVYAVIKKDLWREK